MVYELKTQMHGCIDSGYVFGQMRFTRFGEYAFATHDFCKLITSFAQDPARFDGKILTYGVESIYRALEQDMENMMVQVSRLRKEDLSLEEIQENIQAKKRLTLEEQLEGSYGGILVLFQINPLATSIAVGKYAIEREEFNMFARYVANGGFFGWGGGQPYFAQKTTTALTNSSHAFFKK